MTDDIGVVSVAKRAAVAIAKGEIDQLTLAKLEQRLAQEQFPGDTIGVAFRKWQSTPHGAEMLNAGLKKNDQTEQLRGALSATPASNLLKAFGNEASRQSEYENPDVTRSDNKSRLSDGEAAGPPGWDRDSATFDKAVELLMKERNCSRDAAISEIYRAEKRRKDLSF